MPSCDQMTLQVQLQGGTIFLLIFFSTDNTHQRFDVLNFHSVNPSDSDCMLGNPYATGNTLISHLHRVSVWFRLHEHKHCNLSSFEPHYAKSCLRVMLKIMEKIHYSEPYKVKSVCVRGGQYKRSSTLFPRLLCGIVFSCSQIIIWDKMSFLSTFERFGNTT